MIRPPAVLRRTLRRLLQTRRCCTLAVGLGITALMLTTAALAVQNWLDRHRPATLRGPMPIAHKVAAVQQHLMALRLHEATILRGQGDANARHEWELALASTERTLRSLLASQHPTSTSMAGVVRQSLHDLGEYARIFDAAQAQRLLRPSALGVEPVPEAAERFVAVVRSSMTLASMARTHTDTAAAQPHDASLLGFVASLLSWGAAVLLVGVVAAWAVAVGNAVVALLSARRRRRQSLRAGARLRGQVA